MKRNIITALLYTAVTTVLFGLIYPLVVTGVAQLLFHDKANGQLITENGNLIGSHIIGQPFTDVPIDLVTASASGLDPDITPAAAEFQVARIARERHLSEDAVRQLVSAHTQGRQLGFLGEPRVNVLELNLDLDRAASTK
jgi:K+-transporting ATPase ATPase C chain